MTEESQYPLVTFALFAYNQEKYIREAVEAALNQDYPSLEIILSDDASTDETGLIMENYAASYFGPHRLVFNRNECNLGIGRHINRLFELASGALVIVAAGDDISLPSRVSKTVQAWLSAGRPDGVVHGQALVVDALGTPTGVVKGAARDYQCALGYALSGFGALIHGATAAYTPSVMRFYGPLMCDIEDVPLTFRSMLIGKLTYVDSVLIKYRTGAGNVSRLLRRTEKSQASRWCRMQVARFDQHRVDYMTHCAKMKLVPSRQLLRTIDRLRWRYSISTWTGSDNLFKNLLGLAVMPTGGGLRDRFYLIAAYFGIK